MKLRDVLKDRYNIMFKNETDKTLYNRYLNIDCVVAFYKEEGKRDRIFVIIKTKHKLHALCFEGYMHDFSLETMMKNWREDLLVVDKKEFGNIKKQMIVEALEQGNK